MAYVDGFVVPVPEANLKAYAAMSRKAGKIWKEYGALEYRECALDDAEVKGAMPMTKAVKLKPGETVFFSWIVYKSKADRNRINKKVMADPRMAEMIDPKNPPFDWRRTLMGGFKVIVDM